jgi:creatinine amidohydrolase
MPDAAASSTWPEAAAHRARPAVLPFGALEQHGPHLPLATDTIMAEALAARIADAIGGWLLPAIAYGESSNNDGFPGTISLSFDTVRAIAADIARSLRRSGHPCLIIVNGDFGNQAPLRTAARDLARDPGWPVLVVDYPGLEEIAGSLCTTSPVGTGFYHADEVETSVVLAVAADLVRMERAEAAYPAMPATVGATAVDLATVSPSGVFGDPTAATAETGAAILEQLTSRAVALVRAFLAGLP